MHDKNIIPAYGLYGEGQLFPEILHVEKILDRAAGNAWKIAPHRHPHLHQFLFISRGAAELFIDGKTVTLPKGNGINIPPWAVHGFTFSPETEGLVISLPVAEFTTLFAKDATSASLRHWQAFKLTQDLTEVSIKLYDMYNASIVARETVLRSLGTYLGALVAGSIDVPSAKSKQLSNNALILRFESDVRNRFKERLKLTDYADALAVSPSHLSRTCKQTTGVSASRFIESILFKEACSQLAYTRLAIQQIGYDLGFEDAAYFSRAFRKHTGMSPGSYRKSTSQRLG